MKIKSYLALINDDLAFNSLILDCSKSNEFKEPKVKRCWEFSKANSWDSEDNWAASKALSAAFASVKALWIVDSRFTFTWSSARLLVSY